MKELKIGDWYYMHLGYGGSGSQMCNVRRKTDKQTGAGMFSLCRAEGMGMHPLPVTDIYEAVDENGVVHQVSANDLAANGHIGIGTLEEPKFGHVCSICREDARLLVDTGKYTEAEIEAEFPFAFKPYEEEAEALAGQTIPMTDKQEEILRAAYAANVQKEKEAKEEADRKFAADVAALREKYAYIPFPRGEKWLAVGEKRRNLLAVLKHEFPEVKFSVRTRNGSTSDSVTVQYEDGPAYDKVARLMNEFETTRYNAYEDYHESVSTPASAVCGGFDYVFVERTTSKDVYKFVHDWLMENVGGATEEFARGNANKILKGTDFPSGEYDIVGLEYDGHCGWNLVIKAKEPPKHPTPPNGTGEGVTVTENKEKGGIEIRFPSMPSENIRNLCKACGFRWSRFSKVWYNVFCDRSVAAAEQIVAEWKKENGNAAA